jgi:hypothetical protein
MAASLLVSVPWSRVSAWAHPPRAARARARRPWRECRPSRRLCAADACVLVVFIILRRHGSVTGQRTPVVPAVLTAPVPPAHHARCGPEAGNSGSTVPARVATHRSRRRCPGRPGDIRGVGAGQEQDPGGDLLRPPHLSQWHRRNESLRCAARGGGELRGDQARLQQVYGDALGGQVTRRAPGEPGERRLRARVVGDPRGAGMRRDPRADVDDAAPSGSTCAAARIAATMLV